MIRVVFRFDDPSPVSKRHVEERLFQEFFSRRIPLSCAVIPARLRAGEEVRFTPERSAHLREAATSGLLDVALHGYLHRDSRQQLLLHEALPNGFRHHVPRGFLLTRLLPF